jgi:hypothetical protein
MRSKLLATVALTVFGIVLGTAMGLVPGVSSTAHAQDSGDPTPDDLYDDKTERLEAGDAAQFGVGVRLRYVFVPKGMIELFLEEVPSGVGHPGFGFEFVRRKANFDLVVGLEYENISPEDGMYLEKGDEPGINGQNPDFVEFDGFAMLGLDVAFLWHSEIAPRIDFRYGAGIGIAAVLGDIIQTDTMCPPPPTSTGSCTPDLGGEQVNEKNEDVPPVVPIVNLLIGSRIELAPQLTLNVEAGFRNLFYMGVGTTYMF